MKTQSNMFFLTLASLTQDIILAIDFLRHTSCHSSWLVGFCLLSCIGYLHALLGRHPSPNSSLWRGQIVKESPSSTNNTTLSRQSFHSTSTPSDEVL